jgi:hypothetical protein
MKKYGSMVIIALFITTQMFAQATIQTRLAVTQNDGTNGGFFKVAVQAKGTDLTASNTIGSATIDINFDNTKLAPVIIIANNVQATYHSIIGGYAARGVTYISAGPYVRLTIAGSNINDHFDGTYAGLDLTASYVTLATINFTILDNAAITNLSIPVGSLSLGLFQAHNNEDLSNVIIPQSMSAPENLFNEPLPVELVSFTAQTRGQAIELRWNTATENNNMGFDIERRQDMYTGARPPSSSVWSKIGFVEGRGTSNVPQAYAFTDKGAVGLYTYRLKQIDKNGMFAYSHEAAASIEAPKECALMQNYPNPFNPMTSIHYEVASAGVVRLAVYDMLGREVSVLVDGWQDVGRYTAQLNASQFPSGMYFYKLEAGQFSSVKRLTVIK